MIFTRVNLKGNILSFLYAFKGRRAVSIFRDISTAFSVVLIQCKGGRSLRINIQCQWIKRFLVRIIHIRSHRNNRTGFDEYRNFIQSCCHMDGLSNFAALIALASIIVVPGGVRREPHAYNRIRCCGGRGHQEPIPIVILLIEIPRIWIVLAVIFQQHGAHDRHTLTVTLPCQRVDVRIQSITNLQVLFQSFLGCLIIGPRLTSIVAMRTHNAAPSAEFRYPTGVQFIGRALHKAAQVVGGRPVSNKAGVNAEPNLIVQFCAGVVDVA